MQKFFLVVISAGPAMPKEEFLIDPKSAERTAKRVFVSEKPDAFKAASGKYGQRILSLLTSGPKYPAEIARALRTHHQTVYYHIGRLEKAGLISRVGSESIRGGVANRFALSSDGYAVEYLVKGESIPSFRTPARSGAFSRFFKEFLTGDIFDGWIVVGSPVPHGASGTQARDGHYAVQLGFALGQFVNLPEAFPVKLDVDLKAEKLQGSNLIVVGGPRTNIIAEELNPHLLFKFKQGGFWSSIVDDRGGSYTSELDCIIAKVKNPWNPKATCVLAAGLTGAGTKAAMIGVCNFADVVFQRYRGGDFFCLLRGKDSDGDGKVDSVDVIRQG